MMARSQVASCLCVLRCCFPSLASSSAFPQLQRHNRYRNTLSTEAAQEVSLKIKIYTHTKAYLSVSFKYMSKSIIIYSKKHTYRLMYNFVTFLKLLHFNLKNNYLNFNQSC